MVYCRLTIRFWAWTLFPVMFHCLRLLLLTACLNLVVLAPERIAATTKPLVKGAFATATAPASPPVSGSPAVAATPKAVTPQKVKAQPLVQPSAQPSAQPSVQPSAGASPTAPLASEAPPAPTGLYWVGGVMAIAVGIVAALVYGLRRSSPDAAQQDRISSEAPLPFPAQPHPLAASSAPDTPHVEHPQISVQASESTVQTQADLTPTTRLAKVDIVESMIADLHGSDPDKRRKAIWDLGQRGDSRAVQPLVELLIDADSQQRSLILAAVAEISTRTLKPMNRALLLSLQDENADVRKNAIRDVTRIYDLMSQVSQLLQYAVSDSDEEVQETARWALGQMNRFRVAEIEPAATPPERLPLNPQDPRQDDAKH